MHFPTETTKAKKKKIPPVCHTLQCPTPRVSLPISTPPPTPALHSAPPPPEAARCSRHNHPPSARGPRRHKFLQLRHQACLSTWESLSPWGPVPRGCHGILCWLHAVHRKGPPADSKGGDRILSSQMLKEIGRFFKNTLSKELRETVRSSREVGVAP